jgi:hypothetical protein
MPTAVEYAVKNWHVQNGCGSGPPALNVAHTQNGVGSGPPAADLSSGQNHATVAQPAVPLSVPSGELLFISPLATVLLIVAALATVLRRAHRQRT